MKIILAQKKDTLSDYDDCLFDTYHFPKKYINAIHTGDQFIYYQGDRQDASLRYYFGMGKIGNIYQLEDGTYKAELLECSSFGKNVPIYLSDQCDLKYIESIEYQSVRKKIRPPWQTSIRPISKDAYDFILSQAELRPNELPSSDQDRKKKITESEIGIFGKKESEIKSHEERLKRAVDNYLFDKNILSLNLIINEAEILKELSQSLQTKV